MTQPAASPPDGTRPGRDPIPRADPRYAALGAVVEAAALMEIALRMAFCVMIGSDHAAVVAGGQETHWLIENCDAIARHRADLTAEHRGTIRAALHACRDANRDRNRLVHDAWGTRTDGTPASLAGGQDSYEIVGRTWTTAAIDSVGDAIVGARRALLAAIEEAVGTALVRKASQQLAADVAERDL